jgi:tetratricopeptide (TPR) repeat protein
MTQLDEGGQRRLAATGYAALAERYDGNGQHADAETWRRRALADDPESEAIETAALHVGLARTLLALGRADEAEEQLRRALRLDPASVEAARALAGLWLRDGRVGDAARAYTVLLDSGCRESRLPYAELLWQLGLLEDAEQQYRAALAEPETALEAAAALGVLLVRRGQKLQGEHFLRLAAEAFGDAAALTNHGNALALLGRLDEAEGRYRAALADDPDCAAAQWGLAELYDRRGQDGRASVARKRATRLDPQLARSCG